MRAIELRRSKPQGDEGSRPESNSEVFGEWRHELHGVIESCSRSISCNDITESSGRFRKGLLVGRKYEGEIDVNA